MNPNLHDGSAVYYHRLGCQLLNPENYPPELRAYLEAEQRYIASIVSKYDFFVEIGCFDGRYLLFVDKYRIGYLGIDIVERFVNEGWHRAEFFHVGIPYEFMLFDVHYLERLPQESHLLKQAHKAPKVLVLFPFNLFGNIPDIQMLAVALEKVGFDFAISNFNTSGKANQTRQQYYANCAYTNLACESELEGTRFFAHEGLDTIAYSERFMKSLFRKTLFTKQLTEIGTAFTNFA